MFSRVKACSQKVLLVLILILCGESQAFSYSAVDLLSQLVRLHPLPESRFLSSDEWGGWLDEVSRELNAEIKDASSGAFTGSCRIPLAYSLEVSCGGLARGSTGVCPSPDATHAGLVRDLLAQLSALRDPTNDLWAESSRNDVLIWIETQVPGVLSSLRPAAGSGSGHSYDAIEMIARLRADGKKIRLILGRSCLSSADQESNKLLPVIDKTQWVVADISTEKELPDHNPIAIKIDFNSTSSLARFNSDSIDEIYLDWSTSKFIASTRDFLIQMKRVLVHGGGLYLPVGEGAMTGYRVSSNTLDLLMVEDPNDILSFFPRGHSFPSGIGFNFLRMREVLAGQFQELISEKKREWMNRVAYGASEIGYSDVVILENEVYPLYSSHFLEVSHGEFKTNFLHLRK